MSEGFRVEESFSAVEITVGGRDKAIDEGKEGDEVEEDGRAIEEKLAVLVIVDVRGLSKGKVTLELGRLEDKSVELITDERYVMESIEDRAKLETPDTTGVNADSVLLIIAGDVNELNDVSSVVTDGKAVGDGPTTEVEEGMDEGVIIRLD
ncbi:MAG: hypothetical protein Q9157_006398 [Trypethelium eluteriae]